MLPAGLRWALGEWRAGDETSGAVYRPNRRLLAAGQAGGRQNRRRAYSGRIVGCRRWAKSACLAERNWRRMLLFENFSQAPCADAEAAFYRSLTLPCVTWPRENHNRLW